MKGHKFAFIDIETTGLNLLRHEIIEIGCVITTPDLELIEDFELKIKPKHIEDADPVALKVNHYDEENWQSAHSLKKAMEIFSEKVKDCIMVGHNVAFDAGFNRPFVVAVLGSTADGRFTDAEKLVWAALEYIGRH